MSRVSNVIQPVACDWLDKKAAAKYVQGKGFYSITENSIVYAAGRLKTLREGKRVGKTYFWHKDWLDEWVESL